MRRLQSGRVLRRAVAFGLLGLCSAVAVAWVCAATLDPEVASEDFERYSRPPDDEGNPDYIQVRRYRRAGSLHVETSYCRDAQYTPEERAPTPPIQIEGWATGLVRPWVAEGRDWPAFAPSHRPFAVVAYEVYAYGWPLPALYRYVWATPAPGPTRYQWHEIGMIKVPGTRMPGQRGRAVNAPMMLPYLPVGWGLAVDTATWGTAWWGAAVGIVAFRRWARRRRGRCAACAYDLRGTPSGVLCPECGASVVGATT
jgi:hypothetical protein